MSRLDSKIKNLPDSSGIYLFYNSKKELIYVGKATSLKSRVSSYFRGVRTSRPIEQMIHEVVDIKTIPTDSVLEAIILEANTIKKFQPKYNVDLKDDKSWNYIVITKDLYPRVNTLRQHELESQKSIKSKVYKVHKIFGPYPGLKTKEMMKLLRKLFFISDCEPCQLRKFCKPCFYHQLGQCLGVCTGEISSGDYKKKVIKPLVLFLSGKTKAVIRNLTIQMREASKQHQFEEAGRLRDQLKQLNKIQDIALLNKNFVVSPVIARTPHTAGDEAIPRKYGIAAPRLGEARNDIRIEGYDISNLGPSGKVGSMVVFENGEPKKSNYRKFKIKTVVGQSDVDCLAEVVERRLRHVSPSYQEGAGGVAGAWPLPQVILVDGGVPQVHKVQKSIKSKSLDIPVVEIAKGPDRKKNEFIYVRNPEITKLRNNEIIKWIDENKGMLIRVRDEAHRFAIKYQRSLRKIA